MQNEEQSFPNMPPAGDGSPGTAAPGMMVPTGSPPPTTWPSVIGIILIVMGSLGAIGACFGLVVIPFAGSLAELMPQGQSTGMEGLVEHKGLLIGVSASGMVLGGVLLAGGIGMTRRRGWAVPVCVLWAVLKMIHVLVNAWLGYEVNMSQMEMMRNDPNMAGVPSSLLGTIGTAGAVLGVVWGWALPVFLLIWVARPKIREETTAWK